MLLYIYLPFTVCDNLRRTCNNYLLLTTHENWNLPVTIIDLWLLQWNTQWQEYNCDLCKINHLLDVWGKESDPNHTGQPVGSTQCSGLQVAYSLQIIIILLDKQHTLCTWMYLFFVLLLCLLWKKFLKTKWKLFTFGWNLLPFY